MPMYDPMTAQTIEDLPTFLHRKLCEQIYCSFTVGMTDNDKDPWSRDEIATFITQHSDTMTNLVRNTLVEAEEDGSLEEWLHPENDWICEILNAFPEYMKVLEDSDQD